MIDTQLKGKIAIVTGANNPYGIGAGVAKAFAIQGAKLFLHFFLPRDKDGWQRSIVPETAPPGEDFYFAQQIKPPDDVLRAISELGGDAHAWEADLSNPETISQLFDQVEDTFGPEDILVNNAAHWEADTFLPSRDELVNRYVELWTAPPSCITAQSFDRLFSVNTRSVALLMAEFAYRHIRRNAHWGRIINVSTEGAHCFPSEISYGASKLALEGYTRSAALELGQYGITVNAVSLGPVQTGWITEKLEKELLPSIPLRRIGKPEDVADVILFLASEQSRWLTGQNIFVGGGHAV